LEGTFGDGTETGESVNFTLAANDQRIQPKLARAAGMVFVRRPDTAAPATLCKVIDAAGNLLIAAAIKLEDGKVIVNTVRGATVTYPELARIARLDFSRGKLTYLSDLDPVEKEETSTEDFVFPYRRDKNLYGGPMRMKGVHYAKGLALHSKTVLVYDIGGDYKELRAMLGVDDTVLTQNRVAVQAIVTIQGDGRDLFKGEVKSRDEPKPIVIDVKGVKRLRITVAAPLLDLGNQVNLAEARVSK